MRIEAIDCRPLREYSESQHMARRCNPATVVKFNGRRHVLPVGDSDRWEIFRVKGDNDCVYCVSVNYGLEYAGVQGYTKEDEEPDWSFSIFLQNDYETEEALGRNWTDKLSFRTIARRLIAMLHEVYDSAR